MKHAAIAALLVLALPAAALAQGSGLLGKHDTEKPVEIEANKSEYDDKAKTVTIQRQCHCHPGRHPPARRYAEIRADQQPDPCANGKVVVTSPTSAAPSPATTASTT